MSNEGQRVYNHLRGSSIGIKAYKGPSPLESALEEIPNNMRKSKTGLLDQKLWLVDDQGLEILKKTGTSKVWISEINTSAHRQLEVSISSIAYQRSRDIDDCNIRASTISMITYRRSRDIDGCNIRASAISAIATSKHQPYR